jgi:hypothetical protein
MVRKLKSGEYRIYSHKVDTKTANEETSKPLQVFKLQRNMKGKSRHLNITINNL